MEQENRTIWILRHGLREDSDPLDWCKSVKHMDDPDLQPLGIQMAQRAAERLAGERVDHVISSPFLRTVHSAVWFARAYGCKMKLEYGFHEMMDPKYFPHGIPRLPTPAERAERFPEIDTDYQSLVYPSYRELNDAGGCFGPRITSTLDGVLSSLPGNLMIITHYAVCNGLKHYLTGSYMDGYIELTGIFKYVRRQGAWAADVLCDAAHVHALTAKT